MRESVLTFTSAGHTLVGTLVMPAGAEGTVPAVVLLSGSGPIDRDGNHKKLRLDISRQLAVALAAGGVASLRYDKRGVGESDGAFLTTGFTDNVDDAEAALAALRARPGVDPDRVLVLGHSEGALNATALAGRGAPAAGYVLLSPTARPGEEVLLWQAEQLATTVPAPVRLVLRLLRTDLPTQVRKNHARIKATTTDVARIGGVRMNVRWHREFMAYDPAVDLARMTVPVLALTGSKDLQAPPEDVERIAGLVAGECEVAVLPGLSHILRTQPGAPSVQAYRRDVARPVAPEVVDRVVGWVRRSTRSDAELTG